MAENGNGKDEKAPNGITENGGRLPLLEVLI